jgi:hypothetical protein
MSWNYKLKGSKAHLHEAEICIRTLKTNMCVTSEVRGAVKSYRFMVPALLQETEKSQQCVVFNKLFNDNGKK